MANNRNIIEEQFKYYLENIAKSNRRANGEINFSDSAVSSYMSFLKTEKLFDYDPSKWTHIASMYDITDEQEVRNIVDILLNDEKFIKHDKKDNNHYRSNSIFHYLCFIAARSYFSGTKQETALTSKNTGESESESDTKAIQRIYFGSPGTGKSHNIKGLLKKYGIIEDPKDGEVQKGVERLFRTTFHPDTDYASFVGCYKPIAKKDQQSARVYTIEELADIYKRVVVPTEVQSSGYIEPRIQFGIEYCEYFGGTAANYDANEMLNLAGKDLAKNCTVDRVGITYLKYGINIGLKLNASKNSETITYDFVPQVFTDAYVKACQMWEASKEEDRQKKENQVFLIIEEINRGNCAQIFGDLFQLLDRKDDGWSEYPVKADSDLRNFLEKPDVLGLGHEGIKDGNLCLPPNLNIIATMNTSDQSLFPMDSAFKRRWDWKYIPTKVYPDTPEDGKELKEVCIWLGERSYQWSDFLKAINERIRNATHSDDKLLGYWFVKADKDGHISLGTFVSKVIFYLWNDVFKDYGAKPLNPFYFQDEYKTKSGIMSFNTFFDEINGNESVDRVHSFMKNLKLEPETTEN